MKVRGEGNFSYCRTFYIENNPENCEGQHEDYGYGVTKKKGESIHEFFAAMNMTVENKLFKKREINLVSFGSGTLFGKEKSKEVLERCPFNDPSCWLNFLSIYFFSSSRFYSIFLVKVYT